ncbi:proline dehydrogenase [Paecilomyces lecythidis]|uniref:Proline dehydrogenase n=1 Tax=Paecilomyces lecythidis TaxID=3004212 RepID=A0ABR3XY15_9EURO
MALLSFLAGSKSPLLDPDRNPLLKYILSQTVYTQFCAGGTPQEVKESIQNLKRMGYTGVILGYAKEVVMDEDEASASGASTTGGTEDAAEQEKNAREILDWKDGTMRTVELADEGDFVALKFTGAGKQALEHLLRKLPPSPQLEDAILEICDTAKRRNVRLLFDAEQQAVQHAIDEWTLEFQRRYNKYFTLRGEPRALIYGTYQAYLLSTPATLGRHLEAAQDEGFVLGVKLVRGAYIGSDPRHLICGTKEETDRQYDGIAESLITRRYGDVLRAPTKLSTASTSQGISSFPRADLVLATHNRASVKKARALRDQQIREGKPLIEMAYGQLQGMADDISCELVEEGKDARESAVIDAEIPKAYKYLVWGTVGECMEYLVRRAQENKDAVSRTMDTRKAMSKELKRRVLSIRE